jgi:hypothetical protein
MKKIHFLVTFFIFLQFEVQAAPSVLLPGKEPVLVASKGDVQKYYYRGKGIAIVYGSENAVKVKGYLSKIDGDSITVTGFNKRHIKETTIAINQIKSITKIDLQAKRRYLIISGVLLLIGALIGLLYLNANPISSSYIIILVAIFGVSAFYGLLFSFLFLWGKQWVTKRRRDKGWSFKIQTL